MTERLQLGGGRTATTLRVTTDGGARRIVRQPGAGPRDNPRHTTAPADRLMVEGEFYRLIQMWPAIADRMPACLGIDRTEHVIVLEDLGTSESLQELYRGRLLGRDQAEDLTAYLLALHGITVPDTDLLALRQIGVRQARHAQRFEEPMWARRVEALAARVPRIERQVDALRTDLHIRATMRDLGSRFLDGTGTLLHGDFRPARWIPSPRGMRVLSSGFGSAGPAALDLGFFVAHLLLAGQPHAIVAAVLERYRRGAAIDVAEVSACVGLEIIRGRLGHEPVPGAPSFERLTAELDYAARLLRGSATVELPL